VAKVLAANGVDMLAFSLAESSDFGILRLLVSDNALAQKVLKEAHFAVKESDVVCVEVPNKPGALATIVENISSQNISIEYMYAFAQGGVANIVIKTADLDACVNALK
jgi:hypothetical protein